MAQADSLSITATPTLSPAFSQSVSDYVIRCTTPPVNVQVSASGYQVSVDGQASQTGNFNANVTVSTGQGFSIAATHGGSTSTYYVRCLPTDFPTYTSPVNASNEGGNPSPQAQFYLTAPLGATSFSNTPPATNYVTMYDDNGVPVWWKPMSSVPAFAGTEPNGNIVFTNTLGPFDEVNLSGQIVRTISDPLGRQLDFHEIQHLANGDDLVEADTTACCFDLSSFGAGGPTNATVYDQVIEAINPTTHQVDWSWDPATHINPATETGSNWYSTVLNGGSPYDVYHMNSLATNGSSIIVSFRHLNAVYEINKATGHIDWKLGGNPEGSDNLTVVGDSYYNADPTKMFCGQHDPRVVDSGGVLSDPGATLSVHDNGTGCGPAGTTGRQPRAVRYSINPSTRTATLVEQLTDPLTTQSICCGSARKLPGGDWVLSWGHQNYFTEMTAGGVRVYEVQYTQTNEFSYRVKPVQPGVYTIAQLRAGMNTQFPRTPPQSSGSRKAKG